MWNLDRTNSIEAGMCKVFQHRAYHVCILVELLFDPVMLRWASNRSDDTRGQFVPIAKHHKNPYRKCARRHISVANRMNRQLR